MSEAKDADVDRLTREQIEQWRTTLCDPDEFHAQALSELNALCDLALSALSQEAARDEVLREENECSHGISMKTSPAAPEPFNCQVEGKPCERWCGANPCLGELPESETPETDAALGGYGPTLNPNILDFARSLERRLSIAQTEIKGHMRVVDELRRDLANEVAIVNRVWKALGIETYDAAKPFAIDEHVTLLKTRISELEGHIRVLTRPAWNNEGHMLPTLPQVEAARAALKSRA